MRWILALVLVLGAQQAQACGRATDCQTPSGSYRIALPDGAPEGVVLFFHGYRGTAAAAVRPGGLAEGPLAEGLAFVAPQGLGGSWAFGGAPRDGRDEMAFLDEVLADLDARFDLPMDRIMVTGFSIGGTMAWEAACYRGAAFAGFAPIAGAYWRPQPDSCPSPPPVLLHIHGTADRTVPMQGRPIGPNAHQGDVRESIAQWTEQAGCGAPVRRTDAVFSCERWSDCEEGVIQLCLHDGGHSIRAEWLLRGWNELAEIKGWTE
ncbi:polyhydroxybutyrate depolymerase [Rhodobacteraceae bacterium 2CG4]|uniref:Polyhydroxybutyrate depolymerase n=1 Tax=Halovulum marinum TaxID=2662447 RepID=A0A6L5YYT3_9RHOB|nr:polyhydroxybutyrate depolymerase [Halovulum marinum]MSU89447.1 polyhydroxybutyrate depolymerase [Halovulum marinum]